MYASNGLAGMLIAGNFQHWDPAHTTDHTLVGGFNVEFKGANTVENCIIWGQTLDVYAASNSAIFMSGSVVDQAVSSLVVGQANKIDCIGPCVILGQEGWVTNQGEFILSGAQGPIGGTQAGRVSMAARTTNATITEFSTANTDPISPDFDRYLVREDASLAFTVIVTARRTGGTSGTGAVGDSASWKVDAQIKRDATLASVAMVGGSGVSGLAPDFNDAGASAWTLDIDADTTNGSLRLQATGALDMDITWEAHILHAEAGVGFL
jgi:hypothetical protein